MPDVKLPIAEQGASDKQTLRNLLDTMAKYRKELDYLLLHLDRTNVKESESVVADWIYAGNIQANQIDVSQGKITTAQIEDLLIGNNVFMAPGATISWGQLSNVPNDIVYAAVLANYPTEAELAATLSSYTTNAQLATELAGYITTGSLTNTLASYLTQSNFNTLIGQNYIVTGKILANQIDAGTFTGFTIKTANDNNARIELNSAGLKTYNALNKLHGVYMDVVGGSTAFRIFDQDIQKFSIFYGQIQGDAVDKLRLTSIGCPMKLSAGANDMSLTASTIYLEGNVNISGAVTGITVVSKFA